jgi:Protein of unknown function (DUF2510)
VTTLERERLRQLPAPQAQQPGWYPDPLGTTAERYWDGEWKELIRTSRLRLPAHLQQREAESRRGLHLPSLRRLRGLQMPTLPREAREQRAREREHERQRISMEAEREAFFRSPAGRARLAFETGQRLFQYELELERLEPTVIPGPVGAPARLTEDPVDILNSVVWEGWKLVDGKFFYAEVRGGILGCYLFKRSKKLRQPMNDPWRA